MSNPSEFSARFKKRRLQLGLTLQQVADRLGIAWQSVSGWEHGSMPRPTRYERVAAALETTVDELFYGMPAPAQIGQTTQFDVLKTRDAGPIVGLSNRVPVIPWTIAGGWLEARKTFHPGDVERWLYVGAGVGDMAFALKVSGDSMEPRVPSGSHVVIDPARAPKHGDVVLARMADGSVRLKQLSIDDGQPLLVPANPRHPVVPLELSATIVGVGVQVILDL